MSTRIIKRSDFSQKDFKIDAGLLRARTSSYFIKSDNGFGSTINFNLGDPLNGWAKPTDARVGATSNVFFIGGIACFTWNGFVWQYKFFISTLATSTYTYQTSAYTIQGVDRKIECNGTFDVTIPLLSSIAHYEDITVVNSGAGIITIKTTNPDTLSGDVEVEIEPLESIRFQKGFSQYLII